MADMIRTLTEAIAEVKPVGSDVMAVFHTRIENATASLRGDA